MGREKYAGIGSTISILFLDLFSIKINLRKSIKRRKTMSKDKKVENRLNHVNIGGNYIGRDSIVIHSYGSREKSQSEEENDIKEKTVFLSYNWHDAEIADRIDHHLSAVLGITIKRDVRDIGVWKSIREFMKSIRQQDYAILIISDSYLKSKNCMFEVTELMKEQEYINRIFPAVVVDDIYDPLTRAKYISYWQQECKKLEASIKGLDIENAAELATDLKRYRNITSSIGEFLSIVADRNNPDIQEIELRIEKAIQKNE